QNTLEGLRRSRRHTGHGIAVRAGLWIAQHILNPLLHLRRHRMFQSLGLLVGLPPRESEHLDKEPLRQTMPADDRVGVALSLLGQMHFFTIIQRDEPVALESMDHLRNAWCRASGEIRH